MKAITVYQPYASLMAYLAKLYETRSWATNYRGPIAIHAGLKLGRPLELYFDEQSKFWAEVGNAIYPGWNTFQQIFDNVKTLPRGSVIATGELIGCHKIGMLGSSKGVTTEAGFYIGDERIRITGNEIIFGDWQIGRYAWEIANIKMLPEPIPARGYQRLWNWEG